jgi:hypothetical protein
VSSLLPAACCCGDNCPTGCECPSDTTLPSTVLVDLDLTDCCGNARTFSVTVSLDGPFVQCACLLCLKYSYRPEAGTQCPDACTGAITSEWRCGEAGGTKCDEIREAMLRWVTIQTDGCLYKTLAEDDPEGLYTLYGYCRAWVLNAGIVSSGSNATLVTSILSGCNAGPCTYGRSDSPCTALDICESMSYGMCKLPTSGVPGTPIGTYTACTFPLDICAHSSDVCPTLDTVTVS